MVENTKKSFIIDASFVLAFLLKENNLEVDELIKQYKEREINLISTYFLKFEVGNSIRTAILRKRISKTNAEKLLRLFLEFDILEKEIDYFQTLNLAVLKKISFYDASYLYLARSNKLQLLTLDSSLK